MGIHIILLSLASPLFVNGAVKENYDFKCTDEFCQDVHCPQLPKACKNSTLSVITPSVDPCNCCRHCFIFQEEGEDCIKIMSELVLPHFMCAPGLICNELQKCEKMSREDPHFFENYICENEKCYCAVVLSDGSILKIFGEFRKSEISKNKKQCGCSVVAYKAMTQTLRALPFEGIYQPSARCLENGQFDPLQCIDERCGCVETDTGVPDRNGFIFSLKALEENHPKCFDVNRHKKGYYTPCEQKRNQLMKEMNEEFWGDKNFLHFRKINCNPDGTQAEL